MTEKKSSVESLLERFPDISYELGSVALRVDEAHEIATNLSTTRQSVRDLEIRQRDESEETRSALDNMVKSLMETESLSLLEKIALANAIQLLDMHGEIHSEEVFKQVERIYTSRLSSLKAVEKIVNHDGQPILYFQVNGRNYKWVGDKEQIEPAEVQHMFSGFTDGSGLEIDIDRPYSDRLYGGRHISFGIRDYGPGEPKNFVCGYFSSADNPKMAIDRIDMLVGTATRARQVMKDSLYALQTNPIFVGEKACGVAKQLLLEKQERSLFEITD